MGHQLKHHSDIYKLLRAKYCMTVYSNSGGFLPVFCVSMFISLLVRSENLPSPQ